MKIICSFVKETRNKNKCLLMLIWVFCWFKILILMWLWFLGVLVVPVHNKENICLSSSWCWPSKLGYFIALELTSIFAAVTLQNEHHIPNLHKHRWNSSGSHNSDFFSLLLSFWMTSVIIMRSEEDIIFKIREGTAKVNGCINIILVN